MGDLQLGLISKAMRMSGKSLALPSETIGLQLYIITQTDGVGSVPQIRYRLRPKQRVLPKTRQSSARPARFSKVTVSFRARKSVLYFLVFI